jgi:phosphoribosylformylglycinamidine synthase subunit PurS
VLAVNEILNDAVAQTVPKTATQTYHAHIYVTLRPSVLDPVGTALESSLKQLGYNGVQDVRVGKYLSLQIHAVDQPTAEDQLHQMCDQLFANPVIENYRFELVEK